MTRLQRKRLIRLTILACLSALAFVAESVLSVLHYRTPFYTGWVLLGIVVFLAAYNVRKKLPFVLPIGSSAAWLQLHIYSALLSGVLFGLHIGFRVPNGTFESLLALLYSGAFVSGICGLFLSRTIPSRLTSRGEEVLFERIPIYLKKVRDEVEKLVFDCVEQTGTAAVPEIYVNHLKDFFQRPRNCLWHLTHSARPRDGLVLIMENQRRYLNDTEQTTLDQIAEKVSIKDNLDYQYALQGTLKLWLFVHVPLTWGLLIFAFFHVVTVYAYGGGR